MPLSGDIQSLNLAVLLFLKAHFHPRSFAVVCFCFGSALLLNGELWLVDYYNPVARPFPNKIHHDVRRKQEFLLLVIMETDESIDLQVHVGFNAYGSRIYAGSEEEAAEDQEVGDRSVKPHATISFDVASNFANFFLIISWLKNFLFTWCCRCCVTGACARKKGQGFCLCKAANKNCSTRCRCPHSKCKNKVNANHSSQLLISSFIL